MKVKNTQRQPLDIEISDQITKAEKEGQSAKVERRENLHLGPRGGGNDISRELSQAEMESPDIKRHLKSGRLVGIATAKPEKRKGGDE